MLSPKIFEKVKENINEVINRSSELGQELWEKLVSAHPADIAHFISNLDKEDFEPLFLTFPEKLQPEIFDYLSDSLKVYTLDFLPHNQKMEILKHIQPHEIADFSDFLSDEDLKEIFKLIHKKDRKQVIELLKFSPESAGGVMDTDVIAFTKDITVEKAIHILQKIQPREEIHQEIYVTDKDNTLAGYIRLEDLVLKKPTTPLNTFLRKPEYSAHVDTDQEEVAKNMLHYHIMNVPVVSKDNKFLGIIPDETLVDILEEEASEDVYRISAMAPIKQTYFETPFIRLLSERSFILIALLLVESISTIVLESYDAMLATFSLGAFITMIVSVGGNTSSQTSALAIQGLSSGEINFSNAKRFLKREFLMSLAIALILGVTAFIRIFLTRKSILTALAVGSSLSVIVTISVILGSILPIVLKKFKIDPAFSAGPFLATIMDILGSLIFCYIAKLILS